jgi:putative redox protein
MHERVAYVTENGRGDFGATVRVGRHEVAADEPTDFGGLGEGLDPYEFLLSGLGACTCMTLRMYAKRKGWPLERVEVRVVHAERMSEGAAQDVFTREIRLDGDLSDEERARLFEIAEKCPVHRTLSKGAVIRSTLSEAGDVIGEASS